MTKVTEFLAQASYYIDDCSAAIIEQLTDKQFDILVAATDEHCGNCDEERSEPGIDSNLVRTHETLNDFEASRTDYWTERGTKKDINIGVPAVKYEQVQMFKGQTRQNFIVVDLGEYRVVVK